MTPEKRKRLGELLQRFFAEAGDADVNAIYEEERVAWRAKRDAPIPRLKVTPQRMGHAFSQASKIFARMAELQAKGKTGSQIKQTIMDEFRMSNDTYYRLVDASSDCSDPRNARLLTLGNEDVPASGNKGVSWLTSLIGRKPR